MHSTHKASILAGARRIVVKLGSSVVTTASGIHRERVGKIAAEIARLHEDGLQVIVVTSGARAAGLARLGLRGMPRTIPEQQASAAIGQIRLMSLYERLFADHGKHIGQVLLTAADVEDRTRYLNAKHTFEHLLAHRIIPVVNENDSVAIEELKFGDNDRLSALVAGLVDADLLVLLTDVDGLHEGDPRFGASPLVPVVENIDAALKRLGAAVAAGAGGRRGGSGGLGTGGMGSKLRAAGSACHRGIATVIANGLIDGTLTRVLRADESTGTVVLAAELPLSNRKHWIAFGMPRRGTLVTDAGAAEAVTRRGGSLLPAGVVEVRGNFTAGECVGIEGPEGAEIGRGLVTYDASDCRRIQGLGSARIEALLGYHVADEMVHRDDLVLIGELDRTK